MATLIAALGIACASAESKPEQPGLPPDLSPDRPSVALPTDWSEVEPLTFERMVDKLLPLGSEQAFEASTLVLLADALAQSAPLNVRAAVLLSRSGTPEAARTLLLRLEGRHLGPDRSSDAGDVVAAAGLASLELSPAELDRLNALATGSDPHPDLEVRVECARAALLAGNDDPIPFLLSVLRIGTEVGRQSGEFWPAPLRSAWARERAAEVLAWRAGQENRYSADASIGDREREADRLAKSLPVASK